MAKAMPLNKRSTKIQPENLSISQLFSSQSQLLTKQNLPQFFENGQAAGIIDAGQQKRDNSPAAAATTKHLLRGQNAIVQDHAPKY